MIAYKLVRQLKNGDLSPLFIHKKRRLSVGRWLQCGKHKTKGFLYRPFWHCVKEPIAPHLTTKNRVWCMVEIKDYHTFIWKHHQNEEWLLAKYMKIIKILDNEFKK